MHYNPEKRTTCADALSHKYFTGDAEFIENVLPHLPAEQPHQAPHQIWKLFEDRQREVAQAHLQSLQNLQPAQPSQPAQVLGLHAPSASLQALMFGAPLANIANAAAARGAASAQTHGYGQARGPAGDAAGTRTGHNGKKGV